MTTLSIDLPDELAQRLEHEASRLNMTPQQLAIMKLQRELDLTSPSGELSDLSDADFGGLAHGVINDFREVLERLA